MASYQLQRQNRSNRYVQKPDRWAYALINTAGAVVYVSAYRYASEEAARVVAERELVIFNAEEVSFDGAC